MNVESFLLKFSLAYVLDLLIGDPRWLPHPVRFFGLLIQRGEKITRKLFASETFGGGILTFCLILFVFSGAYLLLQCLEYVSSFLGSAVEVFLLYTCLSTRDMAVESGRVREALRSDSIERAREKVSLIVGRDTRHMDKKEVVRATVESIAENTVDGIIAPLFFAALGGAPLALAYKMVNTLDSMIGHKDERYVHFGRVAAFIDTLTNWAPSRLSGVLFPLVSGLLGFSSKDAFQIAWSQGAKSAAPNAGIPEGAMAGALQVQLGGMNFYRGQEAHSEYLGYPNKPLCVHTIQEAIRVMYATSFVFFTGCITFRFALAHLWSLFE